ncbi:MAG: trigger factor [Bacilli bacterium]
MEKEVIIKIEGEKWVDALDKAFKKLNKKANIDGFRPGKAPKDVFLKKYGMSSLYSEAAEECIDEAYSKMMIENKDIQIVSQPDLSVNAVTDDYIEYKFVLTLKPTVKLGKYTNLKVVKEIAKVTKDDVAKAILDMQQRYIENVDKEGLVAEGDIAIIDFEGIKDGIPFDGGHGEDYSLKIGSKTFIAGFEEQIIGMSIGEKKDIDVTFPEDYQADELKGEKVIFKVTVKAIKEPKLPKLDKDFFLDLGMEGITNKEELEKLLEENIKTRKDVDNENKYIDDLLLAASKNVEVEIPDVMIKEESDRILKQYEEHLQMQGISLDMFYKYTNSDEEALRQQVKEEAINRVTFRLMLEAIALKEDINVTDEEALEEANTLATKYQMEKDEFLKQFGGLEMVKYDLKMRKAIEVLKK